MQSKYLRGVVLAVMAGVLSCCAVASEPDAGLIPAAQRQAARGFVLHDAGGKTHRLADYRGKVLLLDFWATTCGGCKIEIPWYIEFEQQFHGQGLDALGVATDDDWKIVRPYLAKHPIGYPVAIGNLALETKYRVETLPMTLLIDRQGRVAATHVGMVDKAGFEREIEALLKQ